MSTLDEQSHNVVTGFVQDTAGNKGQQVIFENEPVTSAPETPDTKPFKSVVLEQNPITPQNTPEITTATETFSAPSIEMESLPNL